MAVNAALRAVVVDCADPAALAAFYQKLTGLEISYSDDTYVDLGTGPFKVGFQRIDGYHGPQWPDPAKHMHLDFTVADLDSAVAEAVAFGAGRPEFQPGGRSFVVLTDPEGHSFCLTADG
jgi:predicted enzyme related to lactoylglutathione lyase